MLKAEKIDLVKRLSAELKNYKTVGVMPIEAMPDRLFQKIRNGIRPNSRVLVARKSLLLRALSNGFKELEGYVNGNVALLLSNKEPFDLYNDVSSNSIRLSAKPNQIAKEDITIEAGETAIAPGQAVTDLKAAGIDVQIQKGKVVIAKGKVLVGRGARISTAVSKALKMLDVLPFEARGSLSAVLFGELLFTERALRINQEYAVTEIARDFSAARSLTLAINYVTQYNVSELIRKAFLGAIEVGVEGGIYEDEIIERLLAVASLQARSLDSVVRQEEAQSQDHVKV